MSVVQAFVIGIVQGLTEFLPISSSAHLVLFPFVVGWEEPSVAFDVAVHLGTLVSLVLVFREQIGALARAVRTPDESNRRLLRLIVIGTIPAAVAGLALGSQIDDAFHRPVLVSVLLGVTGWFLLWGEGRADGRPADAPVRDETSIEPRDAAIVGAAQAVSLLPGISRSGSTVAAGLARGLDREAAVRFSFLLGIPAIAGAVVVKLPDMVREGLSGSAGAFVVGILTSAISGVFAIRAFLRLIGRRTLRPFAAYCFLAMTVGLLTALARG